MKSYLSFLIFLSLTIEVFSQTDFDIIGRDELSIVKKGNRTDFNSNIKVSNLKNVSIVEEKFGKGYKSSKQFDQMSKNYYTEVNYTDGLELSLPEDQQENVDFHIKSGKYSMILPNNRVIKVGMSAEELKSIFPKSYAKRKSFFSSNRQKEQISFPVYFSFIRENKVLIADAWISFILNKEDGVLMEFYSYQPQ